MKVFQEKRDGAGSRENEGDINIERKTMRVGGRGRCFPGMSVSVSVSIIAAEFSYVLPA